MRIVNVVIYFMILICFAFEIAFKKKEEGEQSVFFHYLKGHAYILILLFTVNSISFALTFQNKTNTYVRKDDYNGRETTVGFLLRKEDKTEEIALKVRPRMLTKEEENEKRKEAFAYLDKNLKGKNKSLSKVTKPLNFSLDYEKYPFDIEFQPEDYSLVDGSGMIRNEKEALLSEGYSEEELETGIKTGITVLLWYGEHSEKKTYEICIFPREENEMEKHFSEVVNLFERREEESLYEEGFSLPLEVEGVSVKRLEEGGVSPAALLVCGIIFCGLLLLKEQEEKKRAEEKRRELLLRTYPWFVNELVLLLGAGMQVKNIFRVLIEEYKREKKRESGKKGRKAEIFDYRDPFMKELEAAKNSLDFGMSEEQVYYRLGRRLKLPCYIKLMTLLEQNVKRGTKGLTETFEQEELAALEERKNLARRYGEEAGTKLLGPMILLLVVIMLMILIPAFIGFSL